MIFHQLNLLMVWALCPILWKSITVWIYWATCSNNPILVQLIESNAQFDWFWWWSFEPNIWRIFVSDIYHRLGKYFTNICLDDIWQQFLASFTNDWLYRFLAHWGSWGNRPGPCSSSSSSSSSWSSTTLSSLIDWFRENTNVWPQIQLERSIHIRHSSMLEVPHHSIHRLRIPHNRIHHTYVNNLA